MKKVDFPCPVCDSQNFSILYEDTLGERFPTFNYDFSVNGNRTYRLLKCKDCTHVYASPRHENLYAEYDGDKPDEIYLKLKEQRQLTDKLIVKDLKKVKSNGSLLDIGCATGDFLNEAKDTYNVEGLELSSWSTKMARERGFTIHQKLIEEMPPNESYDIVTMWGVIEHFEYPDKEIASINKLLKNGGVVALWTGDINTIIPNFIGKKWWYFQGQHIQMFTSKSITLLFEKNGFKKVYIKKYPYVLNGRSLDNSLKRYPFIRKLFSPILRGKLGKKLKITLRLPGEMFAVFEKVK